MLLGGIAVPSILLADQQGEDGLAAGTTLVFGVSAV